MALGDLTINLERSKVIDFTKPFMNMGEFVDFTKPFLNMGVFID